MELLFVTAGLAPYDDTPGAPEVCGALPKALKTMGHRVTVVAPLPEQFDVNGSGFARRLSGVDVVVGEETSTAAVYDGRSMGGTQLVFVEHPSLVDLFSEGRAGLTAQLVFAQVVEQLYDLEPTFDVIHVHDEAAALSCVRLSARGGAPLVFTVYEIAALEFPQRDAQALGLNARLAQEPAYCPAAEAIVVADFVTTTSPGRSARAVSQARGPVGRALPGRRAQFAGVLNGIDTSIYNPVTDAGLVARYTPHEPLAKARNKSMLQRELGLDVDADVPLLGSVESEVGAERLIAPLKELLRNDVQVVLQVLDTEAECADALIELSKRYPDRFQVRLGDSLKRTHAILAASDAMVLTGDAPTLTMAAHRYGAIPVVASDTSAAESCVDLDAKLSAGNAVIYDPTQADGLLGAMRRAAAAFNRGKPFDKLRSRVMRIDHSYERTARAYEGIYESVTGTVAAE